MPRQFSNIWTEEGFNVTYDREADILYIEMEEGDFSHNVDLSEYITADIGTEGQLLGLEVAAVSQLVNITKKAIPKDNSVPWHLLAEVSRTIKPTLLR